MSEPRRRNSKPTTPPPSPDHYWNSSKGAWALRRGVRKIDPAAEEARVAQLKIEAQLRPPRTGRPPASELNTLTQAEAVTRVLQGDVIPATPAPAVRPPVAATYEESEERLRLAGIDAVLALIEEGQSMREICERLGVRVAHVNRWIDSTQGLGPRVRDARKRAAQAWMDRGMAALDQAQDALQLAKAREIAAMCKKYAAISDPAFSDRVQVDTTVKSEDPQTIDQKLRLLVDQVAQAARKQAEE